MTTMRAALAPVREALLRRARDDADRCRTDAEAEAAKLLGEARAEADALIAAAREAGLADAAALAGAELSRAHRTGRGIVLWAQREAYEELRRRAIAALGGRVDVRAALAARAGTALGGSPAIVDTPDGGVIAQDGERSVDCSVNALVDRALDRIAGDLPGLWS